jgi:hypothetical protein
MASKDTAQISVVPRIQRSFEIRVGTRVRHAGFVAKPASNVVLLFLIVRLVRTKLVDLPVAPTK